MIRAKIQIVLVKKLFNLSMTMMK